MLNFTEEQIERYSRHIILPEVGGQGLQKIRAAKVFILGAGGLGSPAAFYLAGTGVGQIGIADGDNVDLSNLQRQILHSVKDVGRPKADSAKDTIEALNPEVRVITYRERLTAQNAFSILRDYDLVLDCCDNFATRYLINDACVLLRKPLISGAVLRFEGQLTTILPGQGPCYRCIYETPPPAGLAPSCQEAGVLGVVPGVIGVLQATEALKYILGQGDLLVGRLLTFNALYMDFARLRVPQNPACPVCGKNPTITELIEYEPQACQVRT